jgi:hypothetical protein
MTLHEAPAFAGDPQAAPTSIEQLKREHHEIDVQVAALEHRAFLTTEEDAELKRLKRLKLAKKDMIHVLTRQSHAS